MFGLLPGKLAVRSDMPSSSTLCAQGSVGNATRLRILPRAQNP